MINSGGQNVSDWLAAGARAPNMCQGPKSTSIRKDRNKGHLRGGGPFFTVDGITNQNAIHRVPVIHGGFFLLEYLLLLGFYSRLLKIRSFRQYVY